MDRTPMKARRQSLVLELVQREPVRSQEQLRRHMRAAGFDVTQATLSRHLAADPTRAYQAVPGAAVTPPAPPAALARALTEYLTRIDRVQQLVLLRTGPGQAAVLGAAIDAAHFDEIVGTVAGDDTILAVAPDSRRARAFVRRLEALAPGGVSSRAPLRRTGSAR